MVPVAYQRIIEEIPHQTQDNASCELQPNNLTNMFTIGIKGGESQNVKKSERNTKPKVRIYSYVLISNLLRSDLLALVTWLILL